MGYGICLDEVITKMQSSEKPEDRRFKMIRTDAGIKLCRWTVKKEDATFFRMLLNRIFEAGSVGWQGAEDQESAVEFVAWATDSEVLGVMRIFEDAGFRFVIAEDKNS